MHGFLKAAQKFSPNPLSSRCIECVKMLQKSLLKTTVRSTDDFLHSDITKHLSDLWSQSFKIYFWPNFFLKKW